jgi:hypothetical protein
MASRRLSEQASTVAVAEHDRHRSRLSAEAEQGAGCAWRISVSDVGEGAGRRRCSLLLERRRSPSPEVLIAFGKKEEKWKRRREERRRWKRWR